MMMMKKIFAFVLLAMMLGMIAGCSSGSIIQVNTPVPGAETGTPSPNGQINVPGVTIQIYSPSLNPLVNTPDTHGRTAGIWLGIWHGIISPATLVVSFFNKDVQMYEVHNNGNMYNLGFLLGVAILFVVLGAIVGSRLR